jgi:hypothetical protein
MLNAARNVIFMTSIEIRSRNDIGSDVILKCNVTNTTRSIWRRENKIISNGLNINPELQHRLRIIGDKTLGEYNLQISDLTERDLGSSSIMVDNAAK